MYWLWKKTPQPSEKDGEKAPPAATNKWQIMQAIGGGIAGPVIALFALSVFYWQLQNVTKQVSHTANAVEAQHQAVTHNAFTRVYAMGQESTRLFVEHPHLREYFYADHRNSISDDALRAKWERLKKEDPRDAARVLTIAELLADFFEQAYTQRHLVPKHDWHGWWNYFMDAWDKSPILRDHFNSRSDWYTVDDVLRPVPSSAFFAKCASAAGLPACAPGYGPLLFLSAHAEGRLRLQEDIDAEATRRRRAEGYEQPKTMEDSDRNVRKKVSIPNGF